MSDVYARGVRNQTFVHNAFIVMLSREPHPDELKAFEASLDEGAERFSVIVSIAAAPEFENRIALPDAPRAPPAPHARIRPIAFAEEAGAPAAFRP